MTVLVVLGVLAVAFLLYAADRLVKALVRARRLRRISERLAAAAVRAEQQQAKREAAAAASAALTSVVPAIKHPLTVPARVRNDEETPD
jgi:Tfp pilus assembly protein PilX